MTENRWADVDMAAWRAAVERADRLQVEVERLRVDRDEWFDAYNALRDQGEPSWDIFDMTVSAATREIEARAEAAEAKVAAIEALCDERDRTADADLAAGFVPGTLSVRVVRAALATEATP